MTDDEALHILREVFSHIDLLSLGQGKPESGIQKVSRLIDHSGMMRRKAPRLGVQA